MEASNYESENRKPAEKMDVLFTTEAYRVYCNLQDSEKFLKWAKKETLDFIRLGTILSYTKAERGDYMYDKFLFSNLRKEELKKLMDEKTMDELLLWSFKREAIIYDHRGNMRTVPFDIDYAEIIFGQLEDMRDTKYDDYGHKWYDIFFFISGWYRSMF